MASLKTTSDLSGNSQSQSDQSPAAVNGSVVTPSVGAGLLQSAQLTSELKNLMGTLLGGPSGSGVSLEQLLQASTSSGQVKPALTPSASQQQPPLAAHTPPNPTTPSGAQGLWGNRKRGHTFDVEDSGNPKRRRSTSYSARQSGEKQHNKGLRHFSQRVCEKVRQKGTTTYNEVADELVKELSESEKKTSGSSDAPIDHKNIRRRVYDALNVLMAMNIISKEKKEIKWIGLPTNSIQECQHIEAELVQTEERIQSKRTQVEELLVQILTFKNLMKRNRERVVSLGVPGHNSSIGLPFIIVNTSKKTTIDCSISSDKSEYVFNFDNTFELHNDIDVLKKMGLDCGLHSGSCTADDLKHAKAMLPKAFESTLDEIALSKNLPIPGSLPHTPTTPIAASSGLRLSPSSLTSTPTGPGYLHASSSPGAHSPLLQSTSTISSLTSQQIATALAQVRQANATLQAQQGGSVSPGVGLDSPGRMSAPTTPKVNIPSPRAVTALVTNALRGTGAKTTANFSPSAASSAKAQLHGHSSSQNSLSPLVKTAASSATTLSISQGGSPQLSKSPGPKIVTVSKLPVSSANAEQWSSLLQALQQNSNLLKQLPLVTGGISLANGSANGTASVTVGDGVSCSSNASLPIQAGQTGQSSPLMHTNMLGNGLATTM